MLAPSATQPLSVESLERLLDRLPASTREQLEHAPAKLTAVVDAYLRGPHERFEADFAKAYEQLDPIAKDLIEWAMEVWRSSTRTGVAQQESLLRVEVMLMAFIEAVRRELPSDVISSVINTAFDEAHRLFKQLSVAGVKLSLFEGESSAEGTARTLRYVDHIRATSTDEDWDAVEAARMRNLR